MGTAAGTQVFTTYGWRAAAALNLGFYGWIFIVIMLRGPHCARYTWFGFEGGWEARKSVVDARKKAAVEGGKDLESGSGSGGAVTPQADIEAEKEKTPSTSAAVLNEDENEMGSEKERES
ncbi:putative transporter YgaY [Mycena venus]|uniref:Putative transporter YgaY n=1 Tax=Mycena venus TaxID=2733690 RepID=A0A8H7D8W6_9AGAR|nr:putative transporter YgaY [Mycena venus]